MTLPYENATSGQNALGEIQAMLRKFGCDQFAFGEDIGRGEVFISFVHRNRPVRLAASAKGYAAAWLKEHPHTFRMRNNLQDHQRRAMQIGSVAVYSILRDWVKGQITAIEIGCMSFEAAFLAHMMLEDGKRVIDVLVERKMLPQQLENQDVKP